MVGRAVLLGMTAVAASAWIFASSAFAVPPPLYPDDGGRYPLGTTFTGPCNPETPLPGTASNEEEAARTNQRTDLYSPGGRVVGGINSSDGPEGDGFHDGPCRAWTGSGSETQEVFAFEEHGGVLQPRVGGSWQMREVDHTTSYTFLTPESGGFDEWETVDANDPAGDRTTLTKSFTMYDACHYVVTGVEGRVLKGATGTPSVTVRKGTVIGQGDTITIDPKSRVRMSGEGGYDLGMGPGEYTLSDSEACEQLFQQFASVAPTAPPPVEVEKGGLLQTATDQAQAIIESAKGLLNEGIFRNLRRGADSARSASVEGGVVKFRVDRNKRRKSTKSCALKGRLRVHATAKKVADAKREVILEAGECAVTKDGRAPRVVRR